MQTFEQATFSRHQTSLSYSQCCRLLAWYHRVALLYLRDKDHYLLDSEYRAQYLLLVIIAHGFEPRTIFVGPDAELISSLAILGGSVETKAIFTKLYGPLVLALTFWLLAFVVQLPAGKTIDVPVPYLGINVPVASAVLVRLLLAVAGFVSLFAYAVSDYTSLFPQHLTMQVFHDQDKIRSSLQGLAPYRIPRLVESANFQSAQQRYFAKLDEQISKSINIPKFFTAGGDYINSEGTSYTVVEKAKKGLQRYHVAMSEGELTHKLSLPGAASQTFVTKNRKFDSGHDDLSFEAKDLLHGLLLMTKYGQTLLFRKMEPGVEYDVLLIAVTRVTVFPWPDISNTVYLAEEEEGLVPIGYAVFH